jgi:hypothetical protein
MSRLHSIALPVSAFALVTALPASHVLAGITLNALD